MNQNNNDQSIHSHQLQMNTTVQGNSGFANFISSEDIQLPQTLTRDDSIEVLGLPVKLENALKLNGNIATVGEFCDTSKEKLGKIWTIGPKSIKYMLQVQFLINERFGILKSKTINKVVHEEPLQLLKITENELLASLLNRSGNERTIEIVSKRYGLMNGEKQTLEEIGDNYGVTRERIRQVQKKALNRMKHPMNSIKDQLAGLIEEVLFRNGGILSAEEADLEIPKALGGIKDDGSSILDLLSDLGWIQNCRIGDIAIYSPLLSGVSLCKLSEKINLLIKTADLGMSVSSIIEKIWLFSKIKDERFDSNEFVLKYCRTDPRIEEMAITSAYPEIIFRHYTSGQFPKKGWVVLMKRVLEEEQMPLHFTEITNKVNDLMGNSERQLDVRRGHSILIEDEIFAHSGVNGTYGLTAWGLKKELTPQVIVECMKKAGFPLHWKQIYNYVSKYKNTKPANIVRCLEDNRLFKKVDAGVYWLNE